MATRQRSKSRYARARRHPLPRPSLVADGAPPKPVLVATDGSRTAGAAIRLARAMSDRGLWAPEAVTVFEPVPVSAADMTLGPPALFYEQEVRDSLLGLVQHQLRRHGGKTWKLLVEFGRSAPTIVRIAKEQGVRLIVLGLGRHGKLARILGAETATRVARHSPIPVLAVGPKTRGLPGVAVAAVDFGHSSVRAAREALSLLPPGGKLHLVHVRWALDGASTREEAWESTYALGVQHAFRRLLTELRQEHGVEITTELRRGAVIENILAAATEQRADVIALGSHNQNIVDRLVIGYTPAAVLRAAECSILIAPPEAV